LGEAALEDVADPFVPPVEALGVEPVEPTHAAGEVGFGGLEDEVIVVRHEAVGVAQPVAAVDRRAEDVQE
jgi:hypothetical protein